MQVIQAWCAHRGASVEGIVYIDVAAADIARLDAFEGDEYQRAPIRASLSDGTWLEAQTYLYKDPQRLEGGEWDANCFDMQRFLQTYCSSR
jgi:hypothetical protein